MSPTEQAVATAIIGGERVAANDAIDVIVSKCGLALYRWIDGWILIRGANYFCRPVECIIIIAARHHTVCVFGVNRQAEVIVELHIR